ncbi:MAG: hypothetical protein J5674_02520 [Candidatus Methanomethylophilaceae archaeon]|nr:hypothetical protein [Candidatus Methanomethylophilaceae archaeon]
MRFLKTIVALAALLAVLAVPAFESDAELSVTDTGSDAKFDTFNGGSIHFKVRNTSDTDCTIDVVVKNGDKTVGTATDYPVKADGITEVTVDMKSFTTAGSYNLDVYCTSDDQGNKFDGTGHFTVYVTVEKNVLSNWTTYVVIIVAVIAVAIIIYIKIRETPKKKNEMTFEQLEEERKAKMAKKSSKKDEPAPSTERKRYLSEKNKKE